MNEQTAQLTLESERIVKAMRSIPRGGKSDEVLMQFGSAYLLLKALKGGITVTTRVAAIAGSLNAETVCISVPARVCDSVFRRPDGKHITLRVVCDVDDPTSHMLEINTDRYKVSWPVEAADHFIFDRPETGAAVSPGTIQQTLSSVHPISDRKDALGHFDKIIVGPNIAFAQQDGASRLLRSSNTEQSTFALQSSDVRNISPLLGEIDPSGSQSAYHSDVWSIYDADTRIDVKAPSRSFPIKQTPVSETGITVDGDECRNAIYWIISQDTNYPDKSVRIRRLSVGGVSYLLFELSLNGLPAGVNGTACAVCRVREVLGPADLGDRTYLVARKNLKHVGDHRVNSIQISSHEASLRFQEEIDGHFVDTILIAAQV
jgi:hypothetical protein